MTHKEWLDKQIEALDSLLETLEEDWESDIIQNNKRWFAQLVIKTRVLRNEYQNQRSNLVGQATEEQLVG